jgi:hypothetical protein
VFGYRLATSSNGAGEPLVTRALIPTTPCTERSWASALSSLAVLFQEYRPQDSPMTAAAMRPIMIRFRLAWSQEINLRNVSGDCVVSTSI